MNPSHIKKAKGNLFCGQFEPSQINRWMIESNIKRKNPALYKLLLSVLLLTSAQVANAQQLPGQKIVSFIHPKDNLKKSIVPPSIAIQNVEAVNKPVVSIEQQNITIRGMVSIANHEYPMYVLDGKVVEGLVLETLDVKRIKKIDILKDAATVVLYGSQAANGVLFIQTDFSNRERKRFLKQLAEN